MKKFFEKNELFKILFISLLIVTVLTWTVHSGGFTSNIFVDRGLVRLGFIDFFLTIFYSIYYRLLPVTFLLALGGFYGVLSYTRSYSYLIESIAKKLKKNSTLFVVITSLLLALFAACTTNIMMPLVFIPFLISIYAKWGFTKIKTFCATFGSVFVGMISPLFANGTGTGYGFVLNSLELGVKSGMMWKCIFLGVSFAILMLFTFMKGEPRKRKSEPLIKDKFEPVEVKRRYSVTLISIILIYVAFMAIMGYLPWVDSFNVTVFEDAFTDLMTYKLGDTPIFSYLLGSANPFGSWDLDIMSITFVIASVIVALTNKMGIDGFNLTFTSGVKKLLKPIFIYIAVNCIFVLAYWSPIAGTIVNKLVPAGSDFSWFKLIELGFSSIALTVDYGFVAYSYLPYVHSVYTINSVNIMLVLNSIYGLCQFILPTSVLLFFSLSYLNMTYKEYLKKMWKFILGLTGMVLLLQFVVIYL